ncbi:GDP-L-fucose synthase family protein [Confluentibacter flavum]|uniref:GDP-L-fucose synthase n=1 Tax=Confluentibacter flavum TaxID=1909700 RepID=A0A2N3HLP0_9FLAO|nr:GDP-L-fucose synthase [Confluentibacter flavum]PKQ45758.1 GDP-L-fucose synthase [Confluentibacter flavum]
MNKDSKIYIAGHRGLVGSAILKNLQEKAYNNIVTRTHKELDLTNQVGVENFFKEEKPEYVFLAAAKVGGIVANNRYRADFIYENMMIQNNVIHQSYIHNVKKLLFLGSTCIYPKNAPQPMKEEYLLTDTLEYTNEPYAIAKIAGIKMCESYNLQYGTNFISVMPTNLYGPNDNFDLEKSHVLPALIRKIHLAKLLYEGRNDEVIADLGLNTIEEAKDYLNKFGVFATSVEIWGSGKPKREFLWSEDMADACVFIMENRDFKDLIPSSLWRDAEGKGKGAEIRNTHINIGTGEDISIKELAETVKNIVGFKGELVFNSKKPDGTMRKLTDVSKLNTLGWKHLVELAEGIKKVYEWFLSQKGQG